MRISDWSSDVCSSDLRNVSRGEPFVAQAASGRDDDGLGSNDMNLTAQFVHIGHSGQNGSLILYRFWTERRTWRLSFRMTMPGRSEEHTYELQSLRRNSYAVFCLNHKTLNK